MTKSLNRLMYCLFALIVLGGFALRFWNITANDFLFYDEGMYLGYNRTFLNLVEANPARDISELFVILHVMFKTALTTAKALWFFILNLRVFILGADALYSSRIISACASMASIVLTYFWAKRYFKSHSVALLSVAILSILPSHVFYGRLGMQESLSSFLFLAGIYLYAFSPRGVTFKSVLSVVLLSAVFFTNYRMIIAPVFLILIEFVSHRSNTQQIDIKKLLWSILIFSGIIFGFGALYGGVNTYVTFGWMFHQADESHAHRHFINFFSFPYYLFTLENFFFGLLFFANLFLFVRKQTSCLLPFILSMAQMFIFSFAAEKGARYLCVVLPFFAMSVAYMIVWLKNQYPRHKILISIVVSLMGFGLMQESILLARSGTDYSKAVAMVLSHDLEAKIISTQPLVESLFMSDEKSVVECPKDPQILSQLLKNGFRYLIIDPQAYISWTESGERFTQPLIGFLEFIYQKAIPVAILPHIEGVLLKRFVLDHNQDLMTSLQFLNNSKGKAQIYIYDLK